MWPFERIRRIWREESPRYSFNQFVNGLVLYSDIQLLYTVFEDERRHAIVRASTLNTIEHKIESFESTVPEEIRRKLEESQTYSTNKIKDELKKARPFSNA